MRPIKFRAFHKPTKKYFYFPEMEMCKEYNLLAFSWSENTGTNYAVIDWDVENYVVEQFTGLLDKNGREIYEGDIAVSKSVLQSLDLPYRKISFNNGTFWCGGIALHCYSPIQIEVIGNIHENPDLLGK